MTQMNISIARLVDLYAESVIPSNIDDPQRPHAIKLIAYNFKVTLFNVATAALVATVALAVIFSGKAFFLAVGLLCWGVRSAVRQDLLATLKHRGMEQYLLADAVGILVPNHPEVLEKYAAYFNRLPDDWLPDGFSLGNVVFWKNPVPLLAMPPVVGVVLAGGEGIQEHERNLAEEG